MAKRALRDITNQTPLLKKSLKNNQGNTGLVGGKNTVKKQDSTVLSRKKDVHVSGQKKTTTPGVTVHSTTKLSVKKQVKPVSKIGQKSKLMVKLPAVTEIEYMPRGVSPRGRSLLLYYSLD